MQEGQKLLGQIVAHPAHKPAFRIHQGIVICAADHFFRRINAAAKRFFILVEQTPMTFQHGLFVKVAVQSLDVEKQNIIPAI